MTTNSGSEEWAFVHEVEAQAEIQDQKRKPPPRVILMILPSLTSHVAVLKGDLVTYNVTLTLRTT